MKIAKLVCEAVAGVPDGSYSFVPQAKTAPQNLTLVAGMRGAGKTSFLRAVVALKELVGSYGPPPSRAKLLEPGRETGSLGGLFVLTEEEAQLAELPSTDLEVSFPLGAVHAEPLPLPVRKLFGRFDHESAHPKLEYFAANRALMHPGLPLGPLEEKMMRAGSSPAKYGGLVPAIVALAMADGAQAIADATTKGILLKADVPDSLGSYRKAIRALAPELSLRGAHTLGRETTLVFDRPDGRPVEARHLSDAQSQAVLIAGTIVRVGLERSIVLLDSPELHVHVAEQAPFLQGLLSLGDDIQWIIATGSAEILKGAHHEQVIALARSR